MELLVEDLVSVLGFIVMHYPIATSLIVCTCMLPFVVTSF